MLNLYTKPLRVYVLLSALALWGILSGLSLPISLFPMSSQVRVSVTAPYGSLSSAQFYETYGRDLETRLQSAIVNNYRVEHLRASYGASTVSYRVQFEWGASPETAIREIESRAQSFLAGAPEEIRRGLSVNSWRENSGFFAISFYSPLRSLDEIYKILEPMVTPLSSRVNDAESLGLFNPNQKEITITLLPERLAQFELTTIDVQVAIQQSLRGLGGGKLKIGNKEYQLTLPKLADEKDSLGQIRVSAAKKAPVFLKDIARVSISLSEAARQKFKTSGVESLILFGSPKEGGNIKNMADQMMDEVERLKPLWPSDIQYKVLVNPSEFINSSIRGVIREVFLAAFLAVIVLFCFIGSFKNVITAAIEIPLSLLLAFILMRLTGMNLNLISLGGLALSAGMNVDASVVVLENIFRHFHGQRPDLTYNEKAKILIGAVNEVKLPIIASTIASLVVFLPLIFTKGLTDALLGDLAKAVIFSHGLSAVVALILVPTIRLQLLSRGEFKEAHSPFEGFLSKLENFYASRLRGFLTSLRSQVVAGLTVLLILPALIFLVIPRLKTEVIGKPESDWMIVGVYSPLFATAKQLESEIEALEEKLMEKYGEKVAYTFTQIQGEQNGFVMLRLKRKKEIATLLMAAEAEFKNSATKFYFFEQWNPSELQVPVAPQTRLEFTGGTPEGRLHAAQDLQTLLLERDIYDKVRARPSASPQKGITVTDFGRFGVQQEALGRDGISHYLRTATEGVYVDRMFSDRQSLSIYLRLDPQQVKTTEQLSALPVGFEGRLVPLGALAQFKIENRVPDIYRENQRDLILLEGELNKVKLPDAPARKARLAEALKEFRAQRADRLANGPASLKEAEPTLSEAVADKELQSALSQLKIAIAVSILLIFLTMVAQMGDVVQSLLVLVAIPLGFIGVILSLWVFDSSLSLNSGLGTILLNGIAVANSIILVDFIYKLFRTGRTALEATVEAASARLRPILMTSLTTVLGMLPIALGLGDGGKILQPLGIAVCGGLWVSMLLTLFFVPALQFQYLRFRERSSGAKI